VGAACVCVASTARLGFCDGGVAAGDSVAGEVGGEALELGVAYVPICVSTLGPCKFLQRKRKRQGYTDG
jgi:hypothetical protein